MNQKEQMNSESTRIYTATKGESIAVPKSQSIAENSTRSTQCDDELALGKNITVGFTIHAHLGPNITVAVTKTAAISHRTLVLLLFQVVKI